MSIAIQDVTDPQNIVNLIYIDPSGQIGLLGSANAGQALALAGVSVISNSGYVANSLCVPGCASPITGTITVPANGSASVNTGTTQPPFVSSDTPPSQNNAGSTTWTNSGNTPKQVTYSIW